MRSISVVIAVAVLLSGVYLPRWWQASSRVEEYNLDGNVKGDSGVFAEAQVAVFDETTTLPPLNHRFPLQVHCDTKGVGGCIKRCYQSADLLMAGAPTGGGAKEKALREALALKKFCWTMRCLSNCTQLGSEKCLQKTNIFTGTISVIATAVLDMVQQEEVLGFLNPRISIVETVCSVFLMLLCFALTMVAFAVAGGSIAMACYSAKRVWGRMQQQSATETLDAESSDDERGQLRQENRLLREQLQNQQATFDLELEAERRLSAKAVTDAVEDTRCRVKVERKEAHLRESGMLLQAQAGQVSLSDYWLSDGADMEPGLDGGVSLVTPPLSPSAGA